MLPRLALGWRGGQEENIYFTDILRGQIQRLNPELIDTEISDILRRLNLLSTTIEGNKTALKWMRGVQSVFIASENRERNVRLIDFDNLDANVYHVTEE